MVEAGLTILKTRNSLPGKCRRPPSMCGFIQPSFIVKMLENNDPDGFNDRQFFVCPPEVEFKYDQLEVPMDPDVPKLHKFFKNIKDAHIEKVFYTLSDEAKTQFISMHDELCTRKLSIIDDEDRRGILSKGKGQLARLSMINCLEQALDMMTVEEACWNYTIEECSIIQAKVVLDYVIDQKFSLMQPEIKISTATPTNSDKPILNTGSIVLDQNPHYLRKFLSFKGRDIIASDISKYRLMPPAKTDKKNKYPVDCRNYMREISSAGFGNIINDTPTTRRSLIFRKRSFEDLEPDQQDTLKKKKILDTSYDSFLYSSDSSSDMQTPLLY